MNLAETTGSEELDSAKRQQILDGARRCFLAQGFDGASINDIVKAAGVSKGTVYAYFPSKEKLFEALVSLDRRRQAEQSVIIVDDGRPVEQVLNELGLRMVRLMSSDESIAQVRTVIAAAEKFPEIGRSFYEAGPAFAIARIAAYLGKCMEEGKLRKADPELAAFQFIDVICGALHKPRMFNAQHMLRARTHEEVVGAGVSLFLNGLGAR